MGDLHQCPECGGCGSRPDVEEMECANCDGTGWLDEHGEPFYMEPEVTELSKETT